MGWEEAVAMAVFPPLVRFFMGVLLVVVVAGGSAVFIYWISTLYFGEDEYEED